MDWINEMPLLIKYFGVKLIDTEDFLELIIRFFFNLSIVTILIRAIYYPVTKRKDYLFTYMLFSIIVFFLCQLLSNVKLGLGFALGLSWLWLGFRSTVREVYNPDSLRKGARSIPGALVHGSVSGKICFARINYVRCPTLQKFSGSEIHSCS